jgi:uncharacterized membrane protein
LSIDVLRGLAILLMIQIHFVDNLSSGNDAYFWLHEASLGLGLIPAPLFAFISGVSYCLWLRKQESIGRPDAEITKVTVRRGLFLFGTGIVFNVLVWLPQDTFNWDILTLIGTSFLFLAYARNLAPGLLVLVCVLVVLLSPPLRAASDYSAYWNDATYDYDFTLEDVLLGFVANGYFPVMPWIIFPLMGFSVGDVVIPRPGRPAPFPWWLAVTGCGLVLLSLLGVLLRESMPASISKHYLTGFTMNPASTEYTVGMVGLDILGLLVLHRWMDQNTRITGTGRFLTFFRRYSAYSLSVYILHHMAHLWPLWLYGTWMQENPTYYLHNAMITPIALALALVFVVVCYLLLIFLDRHGKYGLESLMRWICD